MTDTKLTQNKSDKSD